MFQNRGFQPVRLQNVLRQLVNSWDNGPHALITQKFDVLICRKLTFAQNCIRKIEFCFKSVLPLSQLNENNR